MENGPVSLTWPLIKGRSLYSFKRHLAGFNLSINTDTRPNPGRLQGSSGRIVACESIVGGVSSNAARRIASCKEPFNDMLTFYPVPRSSKCCDSRRSCGFAPFRPSYARLAQGLYLATRPVAAEKLFLLVRANRPPPGIVAHHPGPAHGFCERDFE
jgi:hypothetical protein